MQFIDYDGPTGSQLFGIDAKAPIAERDIELLKYTLAERGVVVLRNQVMDSQQQLDFTAQFGKTESFPDQSNMDNPIRGIFRISNQGDGYDVGHYWHADRAPFARTTSISALLALTVPIEQPTRTIFLNMHGAYLALDEEFKAELISLGWELATRVPLPLVRAHPDTGAPMLSLPFRFPEKDASDAELLRHLHRLNSDLNPRVAGLSEAKSDEMIVRILHHVLSDPLWLYEHIWRPGDLVVWDQRTVYHMATTSPHRRVLSRTAVVSKQAPAYVR
jgi:alpha-ketoglutarate-dependent taurine dioxygenase